MIQMNRVIHIGTHKTGTKTLQRNLFSDLRGRRYISEPFPVAPKLEELFDRIKYQDSLSFDPLCAEELVDSLAGSAAERKMIFAMYSVAAFSNRYRCVLSPAGSI